MASLAPVARPPCFLASSAVLAASLLERQDTVGLPRRELGPELGRGDVAVRHVEHEVARGRAALAHPAREAGAALVERAVAQLLLDAQRALDAGGRHALADLVARGRLALADVREHAEAAPHRSRPS